MNDFTLIVKNKFLSALNEFVHLDGSNTIVVGFSGGADSVCLLHLLNRVSKDLSLNVVAAHINHGIRGQEAVSDAEFCKNFCRKLHIPFEYIEVDCIAAAKSKGMSVEECGREIRYDFFNSLCFDSSYKIATAHNANDNAETVLFNISRGSGIKGACGIPPGRDNIIRPLLYCSRLEIEGYCRENNLEFVTDSTNLCDDYTRNKIRHNVLPVLAEVNSAAVKNIALFSNKAASVCDFVEQSAQDALKKAHMQDGYYNCEYLLSLHNAVLTECIIIMFSSFAERSLDTNKVTKVIDLMVNKGRIQIYGNIYAEAIKNKFRFFVYEDTDRNTELFIDDFDGKCFSFNGYNLELSKYGKNLKKVNKNILDNSVDCDKIVGRLKIRTRAEGDKFSLYHRKVTKSLKKLFNELSVPVEERDRIPVLCDDVGIVWVYSLGTDSRCRINEESCNIIFIEGETND